MDDVFEEIINELDSFLYQAFIDIPQMMGRGSINDYHDCIYEIIIDHIKATHKDYVIEEEGEEE